MSSSVEADWIRLILQLAGGETGALRGGGDSLRRAHVRDAALHARPTHDVHTHGTPCRQWHLCPEEAGVLHGR